MPENWGHSTEETEVPFSEGKGWQFLPLAMQHQVSQDINDPLLVHTTMKNCWQELQVHMCSRYKPFIVYWWKEILVNCKVKFQLYPTNSISGGKSNTTIELYNPVFLENDIMVHQSPSTQQHDMILFFSPQATPSNLSCSWPALQLFQLFQLCTPSWQLPCTAAVMIIHARSICFKMWTTT